MSTVLHPSVASKATRAKALIAARKMLTDKEYEELRDELHDGSDYEFELTIIAHVGGEEFSEEASGRVTVGHGSTRAGKVDEAEMIAWILGHIPAENRQPALDEALELFAKDCKFPCEKACYDQVKNALAKMRQMNQTTVRGSVSVKVDKPQLRVVG